MVRLKAPLLLGLHLPVTLTFLPLPNVVFGACREALRLRPDHKAARFDLPSALSGDRPEDIHGKTLPR